MNIHTLLKKEITFGTPALRYATFALSVFLGLSFAVSMPNIAANITCTTEPCYSGEGIEGGVEDVADGVGGIGAGNPRETIVEIIKNVISFVGLIAVIVIVIAGLYLIFSNGNDDAKEKAKKIIFYTIAGMALIAFASAIVVFVASLLTE